MEPLLTIKDLRIQFPRAGGRGLVQAVQGVDLCVNRGETLVLAGESGSGKTLTALSIARLLPRQAAMISGDITLGTSRITDLTEQELAAVRGKDVAYIFQEPAAYLDPVYTAGQQVAEVVRAHRRVSGREAIQKARELIELVHLPDPDRVMRSYPHQLSGGMNQRVFLAMALASRPKLLVADEPTTALDVTVEDHVLTLLMGLKKEFNFSLLFITHNLSIARRIADRISVMYKGRIVEEGDTRAIFDDPRHDHTKRLIWAYEKIGTL